MMQDPLSGCGTRARAAAAVAATLLLGSLLGGHQSSKLKESGLAGRGKSSGQAQGVLWIQVDALRVDWGGAPAPNIRKLHRRGFSFVRNYAQQASAAPSRRSFLSARRPHSLRTWGEHTPDLLGEEVHTLPSVLRRSGWTTAGVGAVMAHKDDEQNAWSPGFSPANISSGSGGDDDVTAAAVRTLERFAKERRRHWLLCVALDGLAMPRKVPNGFKGTVKMPGYDETPPPGEAAGVALYRPSWAPGGDVDGAVRARADYRAAVRWVDRNIGAMMQALASQGLERRTVVVMHGVRGWGLGEHGVWGGHNLFEQALRTPLVISVPWMVATHGKVSRAITELVDVMPTIMDVAAVPLEVSVQLEGELEGASLLPLLLEPSNPPDPWKLAAFAEQPRCAEDFSAGMPTDDCGMLPPEQYVYMGHTIRTDKWRYTAWSRWQGQWMQPLRKNFITEELYFHNTTEGVSSLVRAEATDEVSERNMIIVRSAANLLKKGWRRALPGSDLQLRDP
eukprot:TRINITY_DN6536_c0_g1_i1.p1 TRINITY_DN6536_c0_g1~~TRINITY_DN6536_c0_g1_i1.p1  ORF type:complete len:506 (+),score=115.26 TRINITY_DN6536_c0_g1_i1:84-1601(+)